MTLAEKARKLASRGATEGAIATKLGMRVVDVRRALTRGKRGRPAEGRVQLRCSVEPATLEWLSTCHGGAGPAVDALVRRWRACPETYGATDSAEVPSGGGS